MCFILKFYSEIIIYITAKVSIIEKIKRKIRILLKRRALRSFARERHVVSYSMANHFAILFEMDSKDVLASITPFVKQLQIDNKELCFIAYYPRKRMLEAQDVPKEVTSVIRKDFTLFMQPGNEVLRQFLKKEFDILIDLSSHKAFPMKMLAALSKAKYKVGANHPDYFDIYDLILDVKDNCLPSELAKHVIHYLKIIKTPAENDQKI